MAPRIQNDTLVKLTYFQTKHQSKLIYYQYLISFIFIHRSDNDDAHSSDTEIHSDSDNSPPKLESQASTLSLNGMIAETPSNEDVASKEDLEDGELEEGEIDDDDEEVVENEVKTEDIADPEPKRSPEQLEKIPPLLLNLKNIVKHEPKGEEQSSVICSWCSVSVLTHEVVHDFST